MAPSWRDPLWGRTFVLDDRERALLGRTELRRLAGLQHHGIAGRLLGWPTHRLEHTLGVWALVVAVAPEAVLGAFAPMADDGALDPAALSTMTDADRDARMRARYLPVPRIDGPEPPGWRALLEAAYAPSGRERTVVAGCAADRGPTPA